MSVGTGVASPDNIPLAWQTDLETIDTAGGCAWCCCKFLCFVSCFFGYFVNSLMLINLSIFFFLGVFVSVGILCILLDKIGPEREEHLKEQYRQAVEDDVYGNNVIDGFIVDRLAERRDADNNNNSHEGPHTGIAKVWTAYFVKVQYQTNVPLHYVHGHVVPDSLRQDLVVQNAFSVPRNVYYGVNEIKVVVLPGHPKLGHLLDRVQGLVVRSKRRTWIGLAFILASILIGATCVISNGGFTILDGIAIGLHTIAFVGALFWIDTRSWDDIENVKSGKGTSVVHAVVPKGTVYAAEVSPPPIDGSHDFYDGFSFHGITKYPEQGKMMTPPSKNGFV